VFASPTGYTLSSFGSAFIRLNCYPIDSSDSIADVPEIMNFSQFYLFIYLFFQMQPVHLQQPVGCPCLWIFTRHVANAVVK
jgi:hypothetical protein